MKIGDVRFGRDAFWEEGVPAFLNNFFGNDGVCWQGVRAGRAGKVGLRRMQGLLALKWQHLRNWICAKGIGETG